VRHVNRGLQVGEQHVRGGLGADDGKAADEQVLGKQAAPDDELAPMKLLDEEDQVPHDGQDQGLRQFLSNALVPEEREKSDSNIPSIDNPYIKAETIKR
jgi:hypothetical protein